MNFKKRLIEAAKRSLKESSQSSAEMISDNTVGGFDEMGMASVENPGDFAQNEITDVENLVNKADMSNDTEFEGKVGSSADDVTATTISAEIVNISDDDDKECCGEPDCDCKKNPLEKLFGESNFGKRIGAVFKEETENSKLVAEAMPSFSLSNYLDKLEAEYDADNAEEDMYGRLDDEDLDYISGPKKVGYREGADDGSHMGIPIPESFKSFIKSLSAAERNTLKHFLYKICLKPSAEISEVEATDAFMSATFNTRWADVVADLGMDEATTFMLNIWAEEDYSKYANISESADDLIGRLEKLCESDYAGPLDFVPDTRINVSDVIKAIKNEVGDGSEGVNVAQEYGADKTNVYKVSQIDKDLLPKKLRVEALVLELDGDYYKPNKIANEFPFKK